MESFLERLKQLQGEDNVSAFARRIGVPQKTLDHLVKGERKPSVEVIRAIALACKVSADWLLGLPERGASVQSTVTAGWSVAIAASPGATASTVGGDCSRCKLMQAHLREITGRG